MVVAIPENLDYLSSRDATSVASQSEWIDFEQMTGIELKSVLVEMRMTQAEFCRLIGCQPPTMSRYVRGSLPVPPPLAALADVLRSMQDRGHDAARLLREARGGRLEGKAAA